MDLQPEQLKMVAWAFEEDKLSDRLVAVMSSELALMTLELLIYELK